MRRAASVPSQNFTTKPVAVILSELETRMSIGMKSHPDGEKEGDRTVTYDQDGMHWTVTYQKSRATVIKND